MKRTVVCFLGSGSLCSESVTVDNKIIFSASSSSNEGELGIEGNNLVLLLDK